MQQEASAFLGARLSPHQLWGGGGSDAADQEEQGKNTSDAAADAGVCGYQKRRLSRGTAANSTDASCAKDLWFRALMEKSPCWQSGV